MAAKKVHTTPWKTLRDKKIPPERQRKNDVVVRRLLKQIEAGDVHIQIGTRKVLGKKVPVYLHIRISENDFVDISCEQPIFIQSFAVDHIQLHLQDQFIVK